jgi:hypothetical protein
MSIIPYLITWIVVSILTTPFVTAIFLKEQDHENPQA